MSESDVRLHQILTSEDSLHMVKVEHKWLK